VSIDPSTFPEIGKFVESCEAVRMMLKPLGDSAWLVEFAGDAAAGHVRGLVNLLERKPPAGVCDVVASFASVAVHFGAGDALAIRSWLEISLMEVGEVAELEGDFYEIPVCYGGEDGPDLEEVAVQAGMTRDEVVARHSGADYTVAAVGFSPGFPYLAGLPASLQVPRKATPRLAVPAGSVAVAGAQAGIYPFATPGGWQLLGRTNVRLFDPHAARPALLKAGDKVRFVPVAELPADTVPPPEPMHPEGSRFFEVIQPGAMTTVQDLGRPGHEASGVSPGGAVDRPSLRLANLLVGNDEGAAALELCVSGPVLRFHRECTIAQSGPIMVPREVAAGEIVNLTRFDGGVRGYLAVSGGIRVPEVMGSASTDSLAGFGGLCGRALRAGDRLEMGAPARKPLRRGAWHVRGGTTASEIELRFLAGVQEDWFTPEAMRRLRTATFQLTPDSSRMGARLAGPALERVSPRQMISQPVADGSIQVPPDGQPMVLLAGRQTIGGYPQIGHVISVDLPKLARAWPGTRVHFREVCWDEARELMRREAREFAWLRTGLELIP
jgi:KipI family sensor histidine kinase inhibitor